jgi:hypothetical protein
MLLGWKTQPTFQIKGKLLMQLGIINTQFSAEEKDMR